jgi:hypothetical protein
VPKPLPRTSVWRLEHVVKQCPQAGERVPRGSAVVLDNVAELPGGFDVPLGPDAECRGGRVAG